MSMYVCELCVVVVCVCVPMLTIEYLYECV